ncbi:hypothetical protein AQJ84_09140 [Streptomyces resistomycificus]|uniref:HEAT repeat domain-containing protein n=1 Tax=Streptomyces resistomycificus TaxID=67356 RepID=UPI0007438915|nr:HEAT repeat domain-containing protein [Streptomyces resistomycificus]KUO00267.1 hypothetical protein AQJ84_09140 [Streptomyces resistomycificus]
MVQVLIAHADGEESLAAEIAGPLEDAGYEVLHYGTVLVGDSLIQQASHAISQGSPVVLCGTVMAVGTGLVNILVSAARHHGESRIFALQMEKKAYLDPLALDGKIALYWQDPAKAVAELVKALTEYYPTTRASTGTTRGLNRLEQRYRDLTLKTCDIVDLANLPIGDRELITKELFLRSLYVSLRVSVDIPAGFEPQDLDRKLQSLESQRQEQGDKPNARSRFPVGERLDTSKRLVVLGDPGAGKSTLLRWIATAYLLRLKSNPDWSQLPDVETLPDTDWLPLYIRCRDLDDTRATGSLEEMIQHHLCKSGFSLGEAREFTPFLLSSLRDGRVLLLIDGLDEISDTALRARFCRQVEQIHVAFPEAPIIVTSRIVGYKEMGLRITRGFEHVTVLDLTPADKDDFARRWCVVTEPPTRRNTATEELISDIHSADRIERLTGNPMLLTTMALVKKKVGKLPSHRADLYREAVDVLLNWRSDVDERMDPHEALPQLQYLAYFMCDSGVQQIRHDEVLDTLERMRREFPAVRAARDHSPSEFLRLLERRTGILVESGHVRHHGRLVPVYEFRHLTFQEYLAGLALVTGRFPGRNRQKSLAEHIATLAAQTVTVQSGPDLEDVSVTENWREAIRLSVMTCGDDDVDSVLLAVCTPLPEEDAATTARPRAALACSCLADEPNVSEEVAAEIVQRFIETLTDEDGGGPAVTVADTALEEVGGSLWSAYLSRSIVTTWLGKPTDFGRLGGPASTVLGQAAPREKDAFEEWSRTQVARLDDSRPEVAVEASLVLMDAAYRGEIVRVPGMVEGLISLLSHGACEAAAAAWALGWVATSSGIEPRWDPSPSELRQLEDAIASKALLPEAVVLLLWCFPKPAQASDSVATAVMSHFRAAGSKTRDRLAGQYVKLFPDRTDPVVSVTRDHDPEVRLAASLLLKDLDGPRAVEPLLRVLTGPGGQVHRQAATALGEIRDPRAVEPLIDVLTDTHGDPIPEVALALGSIGDPGAVAPLLGLLTDPDGNPRGVVADVLGRLRDSRAIQPLLDRLTGGDGAPHLVVVRALGELRAAEAVEPLLDHLTGPEGNLNPVVAETLGRLGDPQAVQPLLHHLTGPDGDLNPVVAEALGRLGDPQAVQPLLHHLTDPDGEPQPAVASALGRLGDTRALQPLLETWRSHSLEAPSAVVAALAVLGDTDAREAVEEAMRHTFIGVRQTALWSLADLEKDRSDRVLLSRDRDALSPGIDPQAVITEAALQMDRSAVDLSAAEIRARYEELAQRYPLTLSWSQET